MSAGLVTTQDPYFETYESSIWADSSQSEIEAGPNWPQVDPKLAPGRPKRAPGEPQEAPRRPQMVPGWPKLAQVGPRLAPSWPKLAPSRPKMAIPGIPKNVEKPLVFICFLGFWASQDGPESPKVAHKEPRLAQFGPSWPLRREVGERASRDQAALAPRLAALGKT